VFSQKKPIGIAISVVVLAIAVAGVLAVNVMRADAATDVVQDPKGDAVSESGSAPPGFLDVKTVKITEKKGKDELEFTWVLGDKVPSGFGSNDHYALGGLSLNPFPTGGTEYLVTVRWTEGAWQGIVIDFVSGSSPAVTGLEYKISGSTIRATVPMNVLGNPDELKWVQLSREKAFNPQNPFDGVTDVVPNGVTTLPWTPSTPVHFENLGEWTASK
jgi:hypothetical protein